MRDYFRPRSVQLIQVQIQLAVRLRICMNCTIFDPRLLMQYCYYDIYCSYISFSVYAISLLISVAKHDKICVKMLSSEKELLNLNGLS